MIAFYGAEELEVNLLAKVCGIHARKKVALEVLDKERRYIYVYIYCFLFIYLCIFKQIYIYIYIYYILSMLYPDKNYCYKKRGLTNSLQVCCRMAMFGSTRSDSRIYMYIEYIVG